MTHCAYNIIVAREQQERRKEMENEEMSRADLIAMLVSIREVARTNGEIHTVEHIDKILEEIRI
nr:MAG TPA: hypothetical protein [Caudoviricetes sp.]